MNQLCYRTSLLLITLTLTAGCGNPQGDLQDNTIEDATEAAASVINGTLTYRERIALNPSAELNIQLQDVSLADAKAKVLAEKNMTSIGQVPIKFELMYDPALIIDGNSYAVRATIYDDGRMLFTTDTHYPVLTRGNSNSVDLILKRIGTPLQSAALTGTYWVLTSINGEPLNIPEDQRAPDLRLTADGNSVQGFSGCNQFSGGYEITDGRLVFGPLAMTMMACPDSMDIEQQYTQTLDTMDRYEIRDDVLILYKEDKEILRLVAADQAQPLSD